MSRKHIDGGLLTALPSPVYVGIDPSLAGFALTAIAAKSDVFESWVYKSPHTGIERLLDIEDWLSTTCGLLVDKAGHEIRDIAIEDGVYHSYSAAVLGELAAIVKRWVRVSRICSQPYPLKVPPTSTKKYATDNGSARKNEVMLAVYRKWGVEIAEDNMADSYVMARMVRGGADTKYEQAVLDKLADPKFRDSARL